MALTGAFLDILGRPTIGAIVVEMMMFLGPVWIGFLLGIMVGWAWKPRWASLGNCKFVCSSPSSPTSVVRSPVKDFGLVQSSNFDAVSGREEITSLDGNNTSLSQLEEDHPIIGDEDLGYLCHRVERKDGGPPWKHMTERSTATMSYQTWQRDMESGPPQYCSRTVYEDATPELLRDFFWDDEFRLKWDDMLLHASTVQECPTTGTMVVHWVRKFPFFCSDREYIIGRRIWESGRSYYCVTKGVPFSSIPRRDKPRRVDLYYSSWYIRAACSRRGNEQLTACEVILFHYEDMGIPWEIAKFGVRQGIWGTVKNIERGFRAYQKARASGSPLSHCALMAQVNTKISPEYLESLEDDEDSSKTEPVNSPRKPGGINVPKLLIWGGVAIVACCIDRGILPKAVIFSIARRFANIGRRACQRTPSLRM